MQSLQYHNTILIVHVCQLANQSHVHSIFDSDESGQQRKGTKCFLNMLGSGAVLEQQLTGSLFPGLQ